MAYREEIVAGAETNDLHYLWCSNLWKISATSGPSFSSTRLFFYSQLPSLNEVFSSRYTFDQATYLGPLSWPHLLTRQISHPAGHHFLPHYRVGRGGTAEKEDCFVLVHVSRFKSGLNDVKWKRNISDSAVFLGQWSNVSKCMTLTMVTLYRMLIDSMKHSLWNILG